MSPTNKRIQIPLLTTGIPNLDAILGGGLPQLSSTIIAGGPGAGKTTLAEQILFHVGTPECPSLYFSLFGEPTIKLLRYQQQFAFFDPERVGRDVFFFDLGDEIRSGGIERVLEFITAAVKERSPNLIAIDSFRSIKDVLNGSQANLRLFIHDLTLSLASWNTTSLLVGEYTEEELQVSPEATVTDGLLWLSQQVRQNAVSRKLQVLKLRGMAVLAGRHSFRITAAGVHTYPHLSQIQEPPVIESTSRARFGVPGLDAMLHSGLPRGQTCLIAGSSGTGKTLLALHFIMAGAQESEPCVMVTFEEHPQEQVRKAKSFGWDLEALQAQGLLRMLYLRPLDLSVDEALGEISRATEAIGARRVIINSISGFELAVASIEHDEFREGLYRLVASLTSRGITVIMTTEVSDLFGEVKITTEGISFIADNIILLRYAEIESALRKVLMVIKMRTSDHDKDLRQYRIGDRGLVVEAPLSQYSGVLSGIPTLRALAGPQPYTPGLTQEEESLVYVLMALHEADAEQLADGLNLPEAQVQHTLDKLVESGSIVRAVRDNKPFYRVAMMIPGNTPRRLSRRKNPSE